MVGAKTGRAWLEGLEASCSQQPAREEHETTVGAKLICFCFVCLQLSHITNAKREGTEKAPTAGIRLFLN